MNGPLLGAVAIAVAASLDWLVREPPERVHPVAWFGRVVDQVDRPWERPRLVGLVAALALPLFAAAVVATAVVATAVVAASLVADVLFSPLDVVDATRAAEVTATVVAAIALFVTISLRGLLETVHGVVAAAETDSEAARQRLPALVGRDPDDLDAELIRSAAVESAAENLSDGLVAPLLAFTIATATAAALLDALATVLPVPLAAWLAVPLAASLVGSLPSSVLVLAVGAGAAAWVKAVNTMDSMVGYPDRPHGTAAARLDDVVMWIPARLSALLLTLAARSPDPVLAARRWSRAPASPNAGWPMGTLASALGVRLEKPDAYELNPVAPYPDADEAVRAITLVGRAGVLAYVFAFFVEVLAWRL